MNPRRTNCLRLLTLLLTLCCTPSLFAQVISANFSANPTQGCAPLAVTFTDLTTAPHTTWAWDFENDGIVDDNTANPTFTYATPGVYTVRLQVTDFPGPNTGTLVITSMVRVFAPPTVNAGLDKNLCQGSTVPIGGAPTASGGTGPYTYSWTPTAGLSSATVANPTVTTIAGPSQVYTVLVTDANGCTNTDQVTVSLVLPPAASAGADVAFCRGFSSVIGGAPSASGGTPPYTYQWTPATGLSSATVANPTATPTTTTTYTLTVRDINNCASTTDQVLVTVNPRPTVNAGANRNFCLGIPATIGGTPTASGASGPYTYAWTPATGLSATTVSNPIATPTVTTTYKVVVTDSRGCIDSNTVTLTAVPTPTASAGPNVSTCPGIPIRIGGAPTASTGTPPYTYQWTPAAGLSAATIPNPFASPLITTNYVVLVTDGSGCQVRDTVTVQAYPAVLVDAGTSTAICIGSNTLLGGAPTAIGGTGPFTYAWSPSAGLSSATIANPVATPTITTIYRVIVTDAMGCIDSGGVTVTVGTIPVADAGVNQTVCSATGITIGGSPAATGGSGVYSYQWTPATGLSSATVANPTATPVVPTIYRLVVTDATGCVSPPDSISVQIYPDPAPVIANSRPLIFCDGDSTVLTTTRPYDSYMWSSGETTRMIVVKVSGLYSVQVLDSNGCTGVSPSVVVTMNPTTVPMITTSGPTTFCQGDSVQLIASSGFASYLWSNGATTPTITVATAGLFQVRATDVNGCITLSDTLRIRVNANPPKPIVALSAAPDICSGDSIRLTAPANYTGYQWSNGEITRSVLVRDSGAYAVIVTDTNGCRAISDSVRIIINPLPAPTLVANGPTRFCMGDSVRINAPTGFISYRWSNGSTAASIITRLSGEYFVDVVDTNGCRGRSDTMAVAVDSLPVVKLVSSGPTTICAGDSVSLQAPTGYVAYLWSNGAPTPTINIAQGGIYWVDVSDTNGCRNRSDSITVTVRPLPTPVIIRSGATTICDGDSLRLTAPANMASYLWSNGDTTRSTVARITNLYHVRVVDKFGCVGLSDTVGVLVNPRPVVFVTASGATDLCRGDSVMLSVPFGFASYVWSNGLRTPEITVRTAGSYWVTITDSNGCANRSDTMAVRVNTPPMPVITLDGPRTICTGDTTQISAPFGYVSYLWSNGDSTQTIRVTVGGLYTVTVTDTNGCSGTSRPLSVITRPLPPKPAIALTGDTVFCEGDSVVMMAPAGYATYAWSTGDSTRSIVARQPGLYSVHVTDAFGCAISSDTLSVTVNIPPAKPEVIPSGLTEFCHGDSVQLFAPIGYTGYLWNNGDTTEAITVGATGDYSVQVFDPNGCSAVSDPLTITVWELPAPKLATDRETTLCFGDTITISAPEGYLAYFWSTGELTESIKVIDFGDYSVRVVDSNGCAGMSDTIWVNVNVPPLKPVITIVGPQIFCSGDSTVLAAPAGHASYLWSTGETSESITVRDSGFYSVIVGDTNGCITEGDPVRIDINSLPVPVITSIGPLSVCEGESVALEAPVGYLSYLWSTGDTSRGIMVGASGDYTVSVLDTRGCTGVSEPATVSINPLPTPKLLYASSAICAEDTMEIAAPEGMALYEWNTGDTTRTIRVSMPGTYMVMVTDSNGCRGLSDSAVITLKPLPSRPNLTIDGESTFCEGDSTTLAAQDGFLDYRWSNGDSGRIIRVGRPGFYTVRGLDSTGCYGRSDSVELFMRTMPRPNLTVAGTGESCLGDSIMITAPAGYIEYTWSTGDTGRVIMARTTGGYYVSVVDTNGCRGYSDTANVKLTPFAERLPVNLSGRTEFCGGDSVQLEAPIGYPGYIWSTGDTSRTIIVRTSGLYSAVVVRPDGCQGLTDTIAVTAHPAVPTPVIATSQRPALCNGDSVVLSAPAGYALYLWTTGDKSRSITVSDSGNYAVSVTDTNGCSAASEPVAVTEHDPPVTQIIAINSGCVDSLSTVMTYEGVGLYYQWDVQGVDAMIESGQGTSYAKIRWFQNGHAVVVLTAIDTMSGCSSTQKVEMDISPMLTPVITGESRICASDSTILDAGFGFNSYLWSTGDTTRTIVVNSGGIYTVEVRNGVGCAGMAAYEVKGVLSAPQPTISLVNPGRVAADSVLLTAMPGGFSSYTWYYNDAIMPDIASRTIVVKNNGLYRVEVTDSNGCHGKAELEVTLLHRRIAGISLPSSKASPGDTITIPVRIDYIENVGDDETLVYHATVRFNKTMLMPVDLTPHGTIDGEDRVIELSGNYRGGDSGNLVELRFLAMLGSAEQTPLTLERFAFSDTSIAVEIFNGNYYTDNICREGGARLFVTGAGLQLRQNRPNPAQEITEIEYEVNEDGQVELVVADMAGNEISRLVDGQTDAGRYLILYDVSNLPSGQYVLRLRTVGGTRTRLMQVAN